MVNRGTRGSRPRMSIFLILRPNRASELARLGQKTNDAGPLSLRWGCRRLRLRLRLRLGTRVVLEDDVADAGRRCRESRARRLDTKGVHVQLVSAATYRGYDSNPDRLKRAGALYSGTCGIGCGGFVGLGLSSTRKQELAEASPSSREVQEKFKRNRLLASRRGNTEEEY